MPFTRALRQCSKNMNFSRFFFPQRNRVYEWILLRCKKFKIAQKKIFQKEKNVSDHNLVEQAVHTLFSLNCLLNIMC